MSTESSAPGPVTPALVTLTEVKFSLPLLLEELKTERTTSSFAMEKLDQTEIGKLFKSKAPRRVKSKK